MNKIITILLLMAVILVDGQNFSESNSMSKTFEIKTAAARGDVPDQNFSVKTFVKEDDVYIECFLRNYRFTQANIWIDGKKHSQQKTAAFILKNLSNGKHNIKVELVDEVGKQIGITKGFEVHIQSAK